MAAPDSHRPQYTEARADGPSPALLDTATGRLTVLIVEEKAGVTLRLAGDARLEGLAGEGPDMAAAFTRVVALLGQRQITLRACGNCAAFRFSGMSYQFSEGRAGYCTLKGANATGQDDVVGLLDRCEAFAVRRRSPP